MAVAASSRAARAGRGREEFFRLGETKFPVRGLTYGPFLPDSAGSPFASPSQTARDFDQIRSLHANVVRVYHVTEIVLVPGFWRSNSELGCFIDIPWNKHLCFLDSPSQREQALPGRPT